jgi:hypothetical protein
MRIVSHDITWETQIGPGASSAEFGLEDWVGTCETCGWHGFYDHKWPEDIDYVGHCPRCECGHCPSPEESRIKQTYTRAEAEAIIANRDKLWAIAGYFPTDEEREEEGIKSFRLTDD